MNLSQLRSRCKPHLWFQLYWVVYLVWFFWLDLTIKDPKYIIHSPLDDSIPFNEWFVFPLSLIHISEPTRHPGISRMPSSA